MKPGDLDDWEGDFASDDDTVSDQAIPRVLERGETTGSYKTLQGYEVARETFEKMYMAKGRTTERLFLLAALRFFLIDRKSHPDAADALVTELHRWVMQPGNRRLVETVLGWDKNPP